MPGLGLPRYLQVVVSRTCGDGRLGAVVFLALSQRTNFSFVRLVMPPIEDPDGEHDYNGNPGRRADGVDVGDAPCHDEDD